MTLIPRWSHSFFVVVACLPGLSCGQSVNYPTCLSAASDSDGNGWGWEDNASCIVSESPAASISSSMGVPVCISSRADPDGDGWGWENSATCQVSTGVAAQVDSVVAPSVQFAGFPVCSAAVSDSDGDGWGYESGQSCQITSSTAAAPIVTTQTPAVTPTSVATTSARVASGAVPAGINFNLGSLRRVGGRGDNWCQTWAADDSVITAMDDGDWLGGQYKYHSRLYKINGQSNGFSYNEIQDYPEFHVNGDGWFAYGVLSVKGVLYSLVSKTQHSAWSEGPFRGMKMLRSYDNGNSWHRVDKNNNDRFLSRFDNARELLSDNEMFFFEESGRFGKGKVAYPFSYATFVQNGKDHSASKDGFVYVYSPEGANSHQLLLARVPEEQLGQRSAWQYFSGWNGNAPVWSSNLEQRQPNLVYPERASSGEYFGWYSWLPSVVWNEGLGLYVMVSGGTYAGDNRTNSTDDYYNSWMHSKSGTLGLWYSENPYGPWTQFYYNENWTVDDGKNLTYQPKLSPKWMSDDGRRMTLVWSDAMLDRQGFSHTVNYKWNQMDINITTR